MPSAWSSCRKMPARFPLPNKRLAHPVVPLGLSPSACPGEPLGYLHDPRPGDGPLLKIHVLTPLSVRPCSSLAAVV